MFGNVDSGRRKVILEVVLLESIDGFLLSPVSGGFVEYMSALERLDTTYDENIT